MSFEFGRARRLYRRGDHPRMLVGPEDLDELRGAVRRGRARKLMDALRRKVAELVTIVRENEDMTGVVTHHNVRTDPRGGRLLDNFADVAFVGALDGDAEAIEAGRRVLAAMPEAEKRGPRDTYSAGYASWGNLQFAYDLLQPHMPPEERRAYAEWSVEVGIDEVLRVLPRTRFLRHTGFNIDMVGMISAMLHLYAVEGDEGVPDLSDRKARLMEYFEATLFTALGPNGYPAEDIGYGSGMGTLLARVAETARRAGDYDAYARCPHYARFGQAMLHFVQPWGKVLSNTGDYGAEAGWRNLVFARIAEETHDPSLLWLLGTLSYPIACAGPTDMAERLKGFPEIELAPGFQVPVDFYSVLVLPHMARPVHPSRARVPTQFMDPARGIVTFRSSWRDDATFVVFDGAHRTVAAPGHDHDSGGHFSLSALGEYFAIDTGRYNIEQDQHNVVLVDGRSGQTTGGDWRMSYHHAVLTGCEPDEFVDSASVDYSQMADCYWAKRRIGLVKDAGGHGAPCYVWTLDDVNYRHDRHEFWWALNTAPCNAIRAFRRHATITGCVRGNSLDVHFVLPAPGEYPKPHTLKLVQHVQLGGSPNYIKGHRRLEREYQRLVGNEAWGPVYARPRLVAKVKGYVGRFLSLMMPRARGARKAEVRRLDAPPGALAARVRTAEVEDVLIFAFDHRMLEADGVRGRGQWCVVRRSRKTGRVLASAMGGGAWLEADGRPLPVARPV